MLVPPEIAEHFLRVYKEMLGKIAGHALDTATEYMPARDQLFSTPNRENPPTEDADLREALAGAQFGQFVVGRHLRRCTKLLDEANHVYQVQGLTNEFCEIMPRGVWLKPP